MGQGRYKNQFRFVALCAGLGCAFMNVGEARQLEAFNALNLVQPRSPAASAQTEVVPGVIHWESRLGVANFLQFTPAENGIAFASAPAAGAASKIGAETAARAHLKNVAALYGATAGDIDAASLHHVEPLYNGAQLVKFTQSVNGVEIFRETATVLMNAGQQVMAINGYLGATANAPARAAAFQLSAPQAVAYAMGDYGFSPQVANRMSRLYPQGTAPTLALDQEAPGLFANLQHDPYQYFQLPGYIIGADGAAMSEPARVKPVWFRLPQGLAAAYYVELQMQDRGARNNDYYSYVIAADDGRMLFRNDLSADVAFTYRVWAEPTGINQPYPGPQGRNGFPNPTGTNSGYQAPYIAPNDITLQNGPISTNDPWLAPSATQTIGNNVEAWANLYAPPAPSGGTAPADLFEPAAHECTLNVTETGDFHACISGTNAFQYTFDPTQDAQATKTQSVASVVNLFYLNNWLHDWYYDAGFKEINGNAQTDNYGRGGVGNDSIKAQAQDLSDVNNANMSTPADGGRPRMRMYIFTGTGASVVSGGPLSQVLSGSAAFGPSSFNLTAQASIADATNAPPGEGCDSYVTQHVGQIVIVDRGTCKFKVKVLNAQNAGAVGVIVVNNVSPGVLAMADDNTIADVVTIPSLMISQADGAALKAALPTSVTLRRIVGVNRDGTQDNLVIAHEWGHYISNRLINDANGLTTNMARGLGEGWADFHAMLLHVKAEDALISANANFSGTYEMGPYVTDGPQIAGVTQSSAYYYGIRRYPYSTNFSKNPLTFKHIQTGVALPSNPAPSFGGDNAEVHNTGEIWATMLWGCYASLLRDTGRLTFAQAQDRMKRYLVAAYKLTPADPTLVEARDAVFAAIGANDAADLALCRQAFADRGAGAGAVAGDRSSATNAGVVESFTTSLVRPALSKRSVDIDGAGISQLVVRNTAGQMQVGRWSGSAFTFSSLNSDPGVGSRILAAADLNGNGFSDLLFQDTSTPGDFGDASAFLDFNPAQQRLLRSVKKVWDVQAVGDLDGDGFADLVWRYVVSDSPDTGVSYIWFTAGAPATSGTNVTQVRKRGGAPLDWKLLGAQDLNGDGAADMLYLSPANQLKALMATPNRTCANLNAGTVPPGHNVLKFADFSGNGRGDILIQEVATGIVKLQMLNANGLILPPYTGAPDDQNASCTSSALNVTNTTITVRASIANATYYASGDFDGDGIMDVVWKNADGSLTVWLMKASGTPIVIKNAGTAPAGYNPIPLH